MSFLDVGFVPILLEKKFNKEEKTKMEQIRKLGFTSPYILSTCTIYCLALPVYLRDNIASAQDK